MSIALAYAEFSAVFTKAQATSRYIPLLATDTTSSNTSCIGEWAKLFLCSFPSEKAVQGSPFVWWNVLLLLLLLLAANPSKDSSSYGGLPTPFYGPRRWGVRRVWCSEEAAVRSSSSSAARRRSKSQVGICMAFCFVASLDAQFLLSLFDSRDGNWTWIFLLGGRLKVWSSIQQCIAVQRKAVSPLTLGIGFEFVWLSFFDRISKP